MAFVAQLTDLHLTADDEAQERRAALDAAVATLLDLPAAPAAVVITGDLADTGHPDEYAIVKAALEPLTMPIHVLPGNHDAPDVLATHFDTAQDVRAGGLRIVLCDTTIPGADSGHLDAGDLAARLETDRGTPTIVALHHPPLHTGIPFLDDLGLRDGDRAALAAVLEANPQVARVIGGHIHRATFETLGGCGVCTCPSTYDQAEPGPGPGGIRFVKRGRGIMLHHLRGTDVISHIQPT